MKINDFYCILPNGLRNATLLSVKAKVVMAALLRLYCKCSTDKPYFFTTYNRILSEIHDNCESGYYYIIVWSDLNEPLFALHKLGIINKETVLNNGYINSKIEIDFEKLFEYDELEFFKNLNQEND